MKGSVGLEEYAATLHAAIENDARLQANMHLLSEYLENKMYFLRLYQGIVGELDAVLLEALQGV